MTALLNTLDIRNSIAMSFVLHSGLLLLALSFAQPRSPLQPLGVELMYGDSPMATSHTVARPEIESKKNTKTPTLSQATDSELSVTQNPEPESLSQPQVETQALGNPEGSSKTGALTGQEGVVQGREVSAEERYLYELQKLLERKQRYPLMAKKMRQTGTVRVRITLNSDGSLVESEVVEKSRFESLNVAAKSLVQEINGLKPFPTEIQKTSWVIEVPIEYVLN